MTNSKFYADRPDEGAEKEIVCVNSNGGVNAKWYSNGQYYNPFLKVRYTPRPWWKFWSPKYTVTFEGETDAS